ncbi:Bug family tripartite tricarboxylate transporter substrate binding protein [Hydrogenophaga intermedia]|uniref:Bug family tripartite tricarboxylate transporter substrate binding protein n=1 Tax=Hydrogenophaga intermedia TaxID=65786 RepID=UPI00204484F1|nr:tripartite tricarboxylate transporter substrate binding protein [Hydrogenophaga intermedia]MCM3562721.1 tripartite tricarboxylate transporter substrate binding protein [Hydrogenophaga intermedia]
MNFLKFASILPILACLVQPVTAAAQSWPTKPLQMIVPQGAGGSTDNLARLVAQVLGERLGQNVVIDNRAGAGGVLGVAAAARAAPDGYTLLVGSNTTVAANAFLYASFPIDPLKDLVPLAMAADAPFALVVPAASPLKSVGELVKAAKAAPGKLNYGSGTSSALLCTELFKAAAGVDLRRVPYKSSAQALTDLMGGQLDVVCEPLSTSLPNVRAGRLRALAQTGAQRSPSAPDLETVMESGVKGVAYTAWIAFYAPAGIPKDVHTRLSNELFSILSNPAVMEKIRAIGFDPRPGNAESLAAAHRAEMASVAATVKTAGIKAE